ncbi:hypothetical protein HA402_014292 [Bradysia odoriphaga]|nr:hypothetical protein HA402_014292 [Bradysia odoriphaga]
MHVAVMDGKSPILFNVTHLQPDTQYAYYIRTWTIDSEEHGGLTVVKYFRTEPFKSGTIRGSVNADGSSEINNWLDPSVRNCERGSFLVEDAEESIKFENELQNIIYISRGNNNSILFPVLEEYEYVGNKMLVEIL